MMHEAPRPVARGSADRVPPHGWLDWAEWVEPVERSVAAMSASALGDRLTRLFTGSVPPSDSHVLIVVDVGDPSERDTDMHRVRIATMIELRAHFPFVDAIAALGMSRYAVLARRHAGLAGTLTSLEDRLRDDVAGLGTVAEVWCEQLPETPSLLGSFLRGVRIKPRLPRQNDRGTLAAGLAVEVVAGGSPAGVGAHKYAPARERTRTGPWLQRSAAAAIIMALLMTAAGASAAAAVQSAFHPWHAPAVEQTADGTRAAQEPALDAGMPTDILSVLAPGAAPTLIQKLLAVLQDADAGEPDDASQQAGPQPASGAGNLASVLSATRKAESDPPSPPVALPEPLDAPTSIVPPRISPEEWLVPPKSSPEPPPPLELPPLELPPPEWAPEPLIPPLELPSLPEILENLLPGLR